MSNTKVFLKNGKEIKGKYGAIMGYLVMNCVLQEKNSMKDGVR